MELSRIEADTLALAGYALAHGVWCISEGRTFEPTLLIPACDGVEWVDLAEASEFHAASVLSAAHAASAVMLRDTGWSLEARVWIEDDWEWTVQLPYTRGRRLMVRLAELANQPPRPRRDVLLEAIYDGVGRHPSGLTAWVGADVLVSK